MVKGAPHYATLLAIKSRSVAGTLSYGVPHDAGRHLPDSTPRRHETTTPNLDWIANYIWSIADDVLRDVYGRGKCRAVILPMTVLRRLDAVLERTKQSVLDVTARLDAIGVSNQDAQLRAAAGQAFRNTSKFRLCDLQTRA